MRREFIQQFSPPSKIAKLEKNIQNFQQLNGDSLYEAWEKRNNATDITLRNQHESILNIETQIGQLSWFFQQRLSRTLPSNTKTNPKVQVLATSNEEEGKHDPLVLLETTEENPDKQPEGGGKKQKFNYIQWLRRGGNMV